MNSKLRILHLTDIHFSYLDKDELIEKKWQQLYKIIASEVFINIDLCLITGDICCHGSEIEYNMAFKYLNMLKDVCKIQKKFILFCPGNHDADTEFVNSTFDNYNNFLEKFYGYELYKQNLQARYIDIEGFDKKLKIITANTNREVSLLNFDNAMIQKQESIHIIQTTLDEDYNIMLMHHPPICFMDKSDLSRIFDKVDLILCGHLHPMKPIIDYDNKAKIITGIAWTPHLESIKKGCQIIEIVDKDFSVIPIYI